MNLDFNRAVRANVAVAAALFLLWMLLDLIDVSRGQSYVPTREKAVLFASLVAVAFFLATWFALLSKRKAVRFLVATITAVLLALIWITLGTILMTYFHVAIGGYL